MFVRLNADFPPHGKAVKALGVRKVPFIRFIDGGNVITGTYYGTEEEPMRKALDGIGTK